MKGRERHDRNERNNRDDSREKITVAGSEDAAEILGLQKRAFVTEAQAHGNWDIEPLRQTLDEVVADFGSHIFLKAMDSGGAIVGSVKFRALDGHVWVGKLIVDPACRGRGLGRRLLAEVEALNPGAGRFQLRTAASSDHNIRLYESVGYRVVREFRDPAQDGLVMAEMVKPF
ncbi:MAG: GNAT family N-acetyltransferase [Alistipes sp.]|jgi:ribosomal protein S18 acetylase RimI-like enzyme|nr:GNAT family N-acetyltransferase [Alistipes sp.]